MKRNRVINSTLFYSLGMAVILSSCGNAASTDQQTQTADSLVQQDTGFVSIFDGTSLKGWEGDSSIWRFENGVVVGEIKADAPPLKTNSFLIWKDGTPANFELKATYRISENGNSGINYRSDRVDGVAHALMGYQADIDGKNNYTGQNYEERKRTTLAYRGQVVEIPALPASDDGASVNNAWNKMQVVDSLGKAVDLKNAIHPNDWNEIHLVVKGNRLQHYINGVLMSDVVDKDTKNRKMSGLLGFQVHVGPPMKVEYKDMQIKILE